jgi:glycosyltransferase involved in cell wall biosynthesis
MRTVALLLSLATGIVHLLRCQRGRSSTGPYWSKGAESATEIMLAYDWMDQASRSSHLPAQLRILHVGKFYPPHPGGMETHLRDLAVRQARVADVTVVVSNSAARNETSCIEGVRVERAARFGTIASMPVCPALTAMIRRNPADLVHIHTPNPGAALAFIASRHTGRLVITHHSDTLGRRALRRCSDPFVRRVMEQAAVIIATSSRYLDSSPELLDYSSKCRVVPLGIDFENTRIPSTENIRDLRQRFGQRIIVSVGRLVPYKGFDVLVRAMRNVDASLLLIGTGPLRETLARLAMAEGVQHKVNLLGRVEDVSLYLSSADCFVLPSVTRAEAFGLVQLEAMAAGIPVVNTDLHSGVPEVSIDGESGITVAPGDVKALSDALQLLMEQKDLRRKLGRNGQIRVRNQFSADLMHERTLSVYSEALCTTEM